MKTKCNSVLSFDQSLFWKALAIASIALHNYSHQLQFSYKLENEHTFELAKSITYLHSLVNFENPIHNFFSFFGWQGVTLFVFLSGYGMSRKYDNLEYSPWRDIWHSVKKFWKLVIPMMLIIECVLTIPKLLSADNLHEMYAPLSLAFFNIIEQLTFTNKLLNHETLLGPWWFFSLTIQLYVIYHLLFRRFKSKWLLAVTAGVSVILQLCCLLADQDDLLSYLKYNSFGWILPFVMGLYYARYRESRDSKMLGFVCLILFLMSNYNQYLWLVQPVFLMVFISCFNPDTETKAGRVLTLFGKLSPYVFVTHALIRTPMLSETHPYIMFALYALAVPAMAIIYRYVVVWSAMVFNIVKKLFL